MEDFVTHWQAAVVPSGHDGMDDRIMENEDDADSWCSERVIIAVVPYGKSS
jgi:hypothetical protein